MAAKGRAPVLEATDNIKNMTRTNAPTGPPSNLMIGCGTGRGEKGEREGERGGRQ